MRQTGPRDFEDVFRDEVKCIRGTKNVEATLDNRQLSALCLSGGGVRSAAFSLGVIQRLARLDLLDKFDYLSTVAAGGFIGAWLTAWRTRERFGLATILEELSSPNPCLSAHDNSDPVRNLSRSMTLHDGLVTPGVATAIALYLRNIALTILLIVPLVVTVLLGLKMVYLSVAVGPVPGLSTQAPAIIVAVFGWALLATVRPSEVANMEWTAVSWSIYWIYLRSGIGLLFLAVCLFGCALAARGYPLHDATHSFARHAINTGAAMGTLAVLFGLALSSATSTSYRPRYRPNFGWTDRVPPLAFGYMHLAGAVAGVIGGGFLAVLVQGLGVVSTDALRKPALALVFGPIFFSLAYALAEKVFLLLTGNVTGVWGRWEDQQRVWVGRILRYVVVFGVVVGVLYAVAIFSSDAVESIAGKEVGDLKTIGGMVGAIATTFASVQLGARTLTVSESGRKFTVPLRVFLAISTTVSVGLFVLLVSSAIDGMLLRGSVLQAADLLTHGRAFASLHFLEPHPLKQLGLIALCSSLVSLTAAAFININRYALDDLRRMQLIARFLGASNLQRKGNPWIGFDVTDDVSFSKTVPDYLRDPQTDTEGYPLLPVINATGSFIRRDFLGRSYRRDRSFIFTPSYCGCPDTGYCETDEYGGGMGLGTIMAISAAAQLPPFNFRLGAWLGNPLHSSWRVRYPKYSLGPLCDKILARTTWESQYVYVSNGGHFDNLGLFEMLRRRCEYIVVVDASTDGEFEFSDLGKAVRRARLELQVSIEIPTAAFKNPATPPQSGPCWAVGHITYPPTPGYPGAPPEKGTMLYLKPTARGNNVPADVRAFAETNPLFPHDPAIDLLFDEAAFESYRALGEWIVGQLVPPGPRAMTLQEFFQAADRLPNNATPDPEASSRSRGRRTTDRKRTSRRAMRR